MVASHNFSPDNLEAMAGWGAIPSPSIAVKAMFDRIWTEFADATLFFGRNIIDPRNELSRSYTGDAYTPSLGNVDNPTLEQARKELDSQPETVLDRGDITAFIRDATHLYSLTQMSEQLALRA